MLVNYHSYKVKIRNNPITTEDGKSFENMAQLSFYDENKKELVYMELGYIDTEDLYKMIDEGKDLDIDYCYIENFSLATYRKSRDIKKEEYVKVKSFSAKGAFFDTHLSNDFSFGEFTDGPITFNNAVFLNGETIFTSSKFTNCNVDLSYTRFKNGNINFSNTEFGEGELNFKNAVLGDGIKNFQDAKFGAGKVTFTNTEFGNGDVLFINTDFDDGEVSFKIARFGDGNIDFRYAKFGEGNISFERTEFSHGKVNFSKANFHDGKINFSRSIFGNGDISFEGCELNNGKLNFLNVEFGDGDINFEFLELKDSDFILDKARFGNGKVSFYSSKIHTLSLKSTVLNNYFDMRIMQCSYIDMSGVVVRDLIDMKPHDFKVDIKHINFTSVCLMGRIYLDWKANNVESLISTQKKTTNREKSEQFGILKQNFNANGNYDYEDFAYVLFKRYEQKADLEEALQENKKSALWQYPLFGLKWLLYDKMGKYATDPFRVLLSAILTYIFFSLVHYIIPFFYNLPLNECYNFPKVPADELSRFGTTFYYSAITFFTVGYGDIYPFVPFGKFVAAIQPFFGTFMMSYFTVAFARKILR